MSVSEEGRWIETCGCGVETWVKDYAYVRRGDPMTAETCAAPHPHDPDDGPTVPMELGWCGCGNPEDVDRMMLAYLANLHERWTTRKDEGAPHFGYQPTPDLSPDAELLIQYVADSLGWTEHGGSVGGAWLTDEGHDARRRMIAKADAEAGDVTQASAQISIDTDVR